MVGPSACSVGKAVDSPEGDVVNTSSQAIAVLLCLLTIAWTADGGREEPREGREEGCIKRKP
jgi:hypothetical protein